MKYQLTVQKLTGREDAVESSFEAYCMTQWELIALFDAITRGMCGHFKVWAIDLDADKVVRECEVSYAR